MHKTAAFGLLLLAAAVLVLPTSTALANYEQGLRAFNAAAYAQAETIWEPLAEDGDARAQYALGVLYETKAGADEVVLEKAIHWYSRAAAQNHPDALTNLGGLYAQGSGVARDTTKAFSLWSRAANLGNALAAYNLGLAYYRGEGVLADIAKSREWFKQSAESGLADAQFAMGQVYLLGVGVDADSVAALTWFSLAERQGHEAAAEEARKLRETGVGLQEEMAASTEIEERTDSVAVVEAAAPKPNEEILPDDAQSAIVEPSQTDVPAPQVIEQQASVSAPVEPAAESGADDDASLGSDKGIVVWLGTFGDRDDAEEFRRKTLALYKGLFAGHPISIVPLGGSSGYRVFAQGMVDGADAEVFCRTLRAGIENAYCAALAL
ncbi:SPOR domain-containing protein [Limibacillus halophilus]|uniref:TPR repeat protein n=1 Tax=Limibacillus halophilus TaxID=1579333 RepID=A0A839SVW7_9PROT|nr:sel1 repeat family protein [Limibacillus halophilus]MBB3065830.1 TPR repeat protein [Limibacillus halophilus]